MATPEKKSVSLVTALTVVSSVMKIYKEYEGIQHKTTGDSLGLVTKIVKVLVDAGVTLEDLSEIIGAAGPLLALAGK